MKKEIINILTLSKGRMKVQAEEVFKRKKFKIIQESERSLIGAIKGYPNIPYHVGTTIHVGTSGSAWRWAAAWVGGRRAQFAMCPS